MTEYRALVDLVVANKPVAAGETFETIEAQVEPALSFGLVEVFEGVPTRAVDTTEPKAKAKAKRSTRKAS